MLGNRYGKKKLGICFLLVLNLGIFTSCVDTGANKSDSSNTMYTNIGGEPTTVNPITSTDGYASSVQGYVLDSLMDQNIETYEWEPALATEYKISDDNTVFTFKLRKGVKWHDGKPFTAKDVKFSFDVIFDDKFNTAHKRPYFEGIEKVEIINDYEVQFKTKNTYFKNFDVAAGLTVLPEHFYSAEANKDKFNKELIGTGAYLFKDYQRGKKIILEKNKEYWGSQSEYFKKQNNFDKIVLRFISDETVSLEMLKKQQLDYMGFQPEMYFKKTEGDIWGDKVFKVRTINKAPKGYNFIGWNLNHPILGDKNVRLALYHLVNRKLMIEKFEYNVSVPADGPVYPQSPYYNHELPTIDFNPEKALELLRGAGWSDTDGDNILDKEINGSKVKFSITILEPWEGFVKYLTIFKEDAKKAGVEINIKTMEWNSFIKLVEERKFDAIRMAWSAVVDWDPKQIWHSSSAKSGSNFVGLEDPKIDELIDKARLIYNREERIKILNEVQKLIVEQYPYVWMTYKKETFYGNTSRMKKEKDTYQYGIGTRFWKLNSN